MNSICIAWNKETVKRKDNKSGTLSRRERETLQAIYPQDLLFESQCLAKLKKNYGYTVIVKGDRIKNGKGYKYF